MIDLLPMLEEKIKKIELQISSAKFDRDNAATPMESASDKSRQLAEQLMDALTDEKSNLLFLKKRIGKITNTIYTLSTAFGEKEYAIVPDGLGGGVASGITLVSSKSPLAQILSSKSNNEKFTFNGQEFTVLRIRDDR